VALYLRAYRDQRGERSDRRSQGWRRRRQRWPKQLAGTFATFVATAVTTAAAAFAAIFAAAAFAATFAGSERTGCKHAHRWRHECVGGRWPFALGTAKR
jgi:hypothetical protein